MAAVNSAGVVSGVAENTTTLRVTYLGLSASGPVQVTAGGSAPPTVVGLNIVGTACSTVGGSAQLQAMAQLSNGTTQNVTTTASWSSNQPAVASVTAGLVSCQSPGTTTINASYSGRDASVPVTVSSGSQPAVLIGIEAQIEANVVGSGSSRDEPVVALERPAARHPGLRAVQRQHAAGSTSRFGDHAGRPLLVVNGPGVLNAAGVLVQALVDPNHYVNVQYGGFTVLASLQINTPVLGTLPIASLQLPSITTLAIGTTLPAVTAILNNGFGGTTNLIVPAATAGLIFQVTPRNYVPILGPIVAATINSTLAPLGDLVGDVVVIANGTVQSINAAPIAGIVSVLGGVLQVDTRAVVDAVASNSVSTRIPP